MSDKNRSSQFLKRCVQVLAGSILLSGVGLALLPTLASTSWGNGELIGMANRFIPGSLDIKESHLSWFGSQDLSGITLKDPEGTIVLAIDKFSTDASLFDFLSKRFTKGSAKIVGLNANLIAEGPRQTNVQRALGSTSNDISSKIHTPFAIALTNVNATVDVVGKTAPLTIHLSGQTKQADLSGHFDVDVMISGIDTGKGLTLDNKSDVTLKMNVANFPVALLDHIVAIEHPEFAGIAQAALGKTLDLTVNNTTAVSGMIFDVIAKTPMLSANLAGKMQANKLLLSRPGTAAFTLTPELISFLEKSQKLAPDFKLLKPTIVSMKFHELTVPLDKGSAKFPDISTVIDLAIAQADFVVGPLKHPVSLNNITSTIRAPETSKSAVVEVNGNTILHGQTIPMHLQATLDKPLQFNALLEQLKDRFELEAQADEIPLSIIDNMLTLNGELVKYIGKSASIEFRGTLAGKHADLEIALDGERLSIPSLHAHRDDNEWMLTAHLEPESQSPIDAILGDSTHIQLNAKDGLLEAAVTSKMASARVAGKLSNDLQLLMTEPAMVQYSLTPQAAQALGLGKAGILQLNKPTSIVFKIEPLRRAIDLAHFDITKLNAMTIVGQLQIDEVSLTSIDPGRPSDSVLVRQVFAPWEIDFSENKISLSLKGDTQLTGKNNGTLQGNFVIKNWWKKAKADFANASVNAKMGIKNVPVLLLGALSGQNDLVNVLGRMIDLDFIVNAQIDNPLKNAIEISLTGENLSGNMALNLGEMITLKNPQQPIVMNLTLTPDRFKAIRRMLSNGQTSPDAIALIDPAQVTVTIHMLQLPGFTESPTPLFHSGIKADLTINSLRVTDHKRQQQMALEKIVAHIDSKNLTQQILFNIYAKEKSQNGPGADWSFAGKVDNALTALGDVNLQGMSMDIEGKSNRLPATLFCQMACTDHAVRDKIEALLGHTIDTDINIKLNRMNGPIAAKLKGSNGRVSIDAFLNNGVLTLARPLEVEVAVTPQLGKSILQDVIPILGGVLSGTQPIKITVDPQGFSIPITNIDMASVQVGSAVIELGKLEFSNQGELASVLALLKPSSQQNLSVWFTPLYLQMQNGALKLQRMDMLLLNRYPIAIWGKVNFPKDNVDLTIGLSGTALSQALGLSHLEQKYMMQLPFRGRIGEASIDKNQATTRISALVAQSQGGPQGVIIGTFLDIAGGSLGESDPPKPTTNPLPWANQIANSDNDSSKKSTADKALNHIEKGATKLIKSIFK